MAKKEQQFKNWTVQIMDNGSVTVLKDGNVCSVAKTELKAIAEANNWPIEEVWTTQELGKFVVDVLEMSQNKTIKFDGRTTVEKLKRYFKCVYNVSLRIYDDGKLADNSKKLSELRSDGAKNTGVLECRANITVGSLIKRVKEQFGLDIKIATQDDWVLVLDGITLANAGIIKKNATPDDMKGMVGYQREECSKEKNDSIIKCSTSELQNFNLHDLTSSLNITFIDDDMEPLSEDALANLKDGLTGYLKSITYISTEEGSKIEGKLPDDFDLNIDGQFLTDDYPYDYPANVLTVDYVDQTLGAILTYAKNNGVNAVVCLRLEGTNYGNMTTALECAALIHGQSSCFEFIAFQQENEDEELEYVDDEGGVYEECFIVELLHDDCWDNFEKDPWERIDDEDEAWEQQEKLDKLIEKAAFPGGVEYPHH